MSGTTRNRYKARSKLMKRLNTGTSRGPRRHRKHEARLMRSAARRLTEGDRA
jgi:hypothetical protein